MDNIFITEEIYIREFVETDFPLLEQLYEKEGWMTFIRRKDDALRAWKNSTIALVAVDGNSIIGLVRALTDREITTYVAEVIVAADYRGKGIGKALLDECHNLYPHTRLDLLSSESADEFYKHEKFREIPGFRKSYL